MLKISRRLFRIGSIATLSGTIAVLGYVGGIRSVSQPAAMSQRSYMSHRPVRLASTVTAPVRPTTVLVHGLDSSKETWTGLISELSKAGYPVIALDLRGHGESPLGNVVDFTTDNLAKDVLVAVEALDVTDPFILVGHSMGGRVAMRIAAIDAEDAHSNQKIPRLAACVIEDMDLRPREMPQPPDHELTAQQSEQLLRFEGAQGRTWSTWEECRAALLPWYNNDEARVDAWRGTRIRPIPGGGWWSDINPAAQRLARRHVLAGEGGNESWDRLAAAAAAHGGRLPFPLHVWVAGREGTVCKWEGPGGVEDMARRLPAAAVREFSGSTHSVHNSARPEFLTALMALVDAAALAHGSPAKTPSAA